MGMITVPVSVAGKGYGRVQKKPEGPPLDVAKTLSASRIQTPPAPMTASPTFGHLSAVNQPGVAQDMVLVALSGLSSAVPKLGGAIRRVQDAFSQGENAQVRMQIEGSEALFSGVLGGAIALALHKTGAMAHITQPLERRLASVTDEKIKKLLLTAPAMSAINLMANYLAASMSRWVSGDRGIVSEASQLTSSINRSLDSLSQIPAFNAVPISSANRPPSIPVNPPVPPSHQLYYQA